MLCFASRTGLLEETPAKALEHCIELFGNPREHIPLTEIKCATWFLRGWI